MTRSPKRRITKLAGCLGLPLVAVSLIAGAIAGCAASKTYLDPAPPEREGASYSGPRHRAMGSPSGSTSTLSTKGLLSSRAHRGPDRTCAAPPPAIPPRPRRRALDHPESQTDPRATPARGRPPRHRRADANATRPTAEADGPRPAEAHRRQGDVAGYIATVDVTQQFHNPYAEKIEAVYVFPLPAQRGRERVRDDHRRPQDPRDHPRARRRPSRFTTRPSAQGYVASLLTQERPNVFTQSVANIEPGKQIDIDIRYFNTLGYSDGWYEFVFPMVVGPRFNPPGMHGRHRRGRPRRARAHRGRRRKCTYLRPDERSGHDISLAVNLDAGVPIEQIESRNHQVTVERSRTPASRDVALDPADTIPNKDFVLRYKVAGDDVKSA